MSQEEIFLIKVTEWFGYCNRYSTIERVGNRTGARPVFVPKLDVRRCSRSNLRSSLLRFGTRPNEWGAQ